MVVLGDLNDRVGNEVVEGIVGQHGVPRRNKVTNDYWRCVRAGDSAGSQWVQEKGCVYKYTWLRISEGRLVDRALMDYVLLPKRMLGRLLDVKVWRREGGGMSDHFLVEARLKLVGGWSG